MASISSSGIKQLTELMNSAAFSGLTRSLEQYRQLQGTWVAQLTVPPVVIDTEWLRPTLDLARQLQETAVVSLQPMLDDWQSQQRDILAAVQQQLEGAQITASSIRALNETFTELASVIRRAWEPLHALLQQAQLEADEIEPVFSQAGFWLSPSTPYRVFVATRSLHRNGRLTPDIVKRIMVAVYRKDNGGTIREMIADWYADERFARRRHIVDAALNAHLAGDYVLSIPALLPQIEGVVIEFAEGGRYGQLEPAAKEVVRMILEKSGWLTPISSTPFEKEMRKFYAGTRQEEFSPGPFREKALRDWNRPPSEILNRHAILHGVDVDYASEENSLRAFLFLDTLHLLADQQSETKRSEVGPLARD